jgi:predicted transcriptional regulator
MREELNEKEWELVDSLILLGVGKAEARAIVYIQKKQPCTSRDIEFGADLRQPEVSTAVNKMIKKGWVKRKNQKQPDNGKGRPIHIYSIKKNIKKIIKEKTAEKEEELKKMKKQIKNVNKLIA